MVKAFKTLLLLGAQQALAQTGQLTKTNLRGAAKKVAENKATVTEDAPTETEGQLTGTPSSRLRGSVVKESDQTVANSLEEIFTRDMFDKIFYQSSNGCKGENNGYYNYDSLITAAKLFPDFGNMKQSDGRVLSKEIALREVVAFLAQSAKETTGGWKKDPTVPGSQDPTGPQWWPASLPAMPGAGDTASEQEINPTGTYSWGMCFPSENGCYPFNCPAYVEYADHTTKTGDYCLKQGLPYGCMPYVGPDGRMQEYYGRGPLQLSYNYNYASFSWWMYGDTRLLQTPDLIAQDSVLGFKAALWFWMDINGKSAKPSAHDIMTNPDKVNAEFSNFGLAGYGLVSNVVNGGIECDSTATANGKVEQIERVHFFRMFTDVLGVDAGENLDCSKMKHF